METSLDRKNTFHGRLHVYLSETSRQWVFAFTKIWAVDGGTRKAQLQHSLLDD